jgi:hypothetical protein
VRLLKLPAPVPIQAMAFKANHRNRDEELPLSRQALVPLAVALRSMLAETEAKITAAEPAEKPGLQQRAQALRDWLTPRSTLRLST